MSYAFRPGYLCALVLLAIAICGCESGSEPKKAARVDRGPMKSDSPDFARAQAKSAEYDFGDWRDSSSSRCESINNLENHNAGPTSGSAPTPDSTAEGIGPGMSGDKHDRIEETPFRLVKDEPLSTFSIDVDTASYSKVRMHLTQLHRLPPKDAVRIEELLNYFDYAYAPPDKEHPFSAHLAVAGCPWEPAHRLVRIGLKGKVINPEDHPSKNLVFLVDVSGSMNAPLRLPLVKYGLDQLTRQLTARDHVSLVVYAGAAGMVLPPTSGADQTRIRDAIHRLQSGGSTNGGEGIRLAYQTAREHFVEGGVNRVILCTDGDFNVGVTSPAELVSLAQQNAKTGVFLSVLGFGMGNHNDSLMLQIADKANGNYAFIDSQAEATKVLVTQMAGTIVTIAQDVKIQVEFNPARVASYRLIGYEKRLLAKEDFNDDKKDAGEIGAGHTVTALYEVALSGDRAAGKPAVDPLKYQADRPVLPAADSPELLTLKLRYKQPSASESRLMSVTATDASTKFADAPDDFRFAAAVAGFGMLLRESPEKGQLTYSDVISIAERAKGPDKFGYREEFLLLVRHAQQLSGQTSLSRK